MAESRSKTKPQYVVRIGEGYYKADSRYRPVPRAQADRLTHKQANLIECKLRRVGFKGSSTEPA